MKTRLLIILAVLLVLGWLIYVKIKGITSRVDFDVSFRKAQLSTLNLADFITGAGVFRLVFGLKVYNYNKIKVTVKDLKLKVFYKGVLLGESSPNNPKIITINPDGITELDYSADVYLNRNLISVLKELMDEKNLTITYDVRCTVYGIPIHITEEVKAI